MDDGSGDETPGRLAALPAAVSVPVLLAGELRSRRRPQSRRARGRGEIVLFLGDDTVPEPALLAVHAHAHAEKRPHPVAVLGYTTWPRELTRLAVSPPHQRVRPAVRLRADPRSGAACRSTSSTRRTSRCRAPCCWKPASSTRAFPHAAWEDIEVAYRLMQRGMRMLYRPSAVARHHHDITFASFRRRQEKAGEAAAIFYREASGARRLPRRAAGDGGASASALAPRAAASRSGRPWRSAGSFRADGERSTAFSGRTTSGACAAGSRVSGRSPADDAVTPQRGQAPSDHSAGTAPQVTEPEGLRSRAEVNRVASFLLH